MAGGKPFGARTHALEQYLQELIVPPPTYAHVTAHQGHPYNEFADTLAKAVAESGLRLPHPPDETVRAFLNADLTWLGVMARNTWQQGLPLGAGGLLRWNPEHFRGPTSLRPDQLIPVQPPRLEGLGSQPFEMKILSLNAQSLRGKHKYFEEQLEALGCNLVFFQETKSSSCLTNSRAFLKLGSDGQSHWGVSVWVSRKLGIFSANGRACLVKEADVHVIHEGPRLLILSFALDGKRLIAFSGHCPHAARAEEARLFIKTLREALHPFKKAALVVGGLDLNGRVVTNVSQVTGEIAFGEVDDNGKAMTEAATFLQLWFPSTFGRLHVGEHMTYQQANGAEHRIDYITLGGAADIFRLKSWVEFDFDSASPNDDHWPVMVHLEGAIQAARDTVTGHTLWRPSYDSERLMSTEGRAYFESKLSEYQHPPWQLDPSEHCQHLQDFLHGILQDGFAKSESRPRAPFIPDWVWGLREVKLRLKYQTRHRAQFWQQMLPRAFLQWKEWTDYHVEALVSKQGFLYKLAAAAVRFATARIRRGIVTGKADYLKGLASSAGSRAGDIVAIAKKAGVGGRSAKAFLRPLPILLDKTGSPAKCKEDRDNIWLQHFGAQEFGTVLSTASFIALDSALPCVDEDLEWRVEDLPSFFEVEAVLRAAPRGKAVGLDGLPGEALSACPTAMAKLVHPLMLKASLLLRQPLQWRGGLLNEMWKRSGSQASPDCYRSIFISSHLGKCYHKLLRERAVPTVAKALHGMHLGAKRRIASDFWSPLHPMPPEAPQG